MAVVRGGIYLEDNPPRVKQFRAGRRSAPKPAIVVHTAESGTDTSGADPKAENVADFIQGRTSVGSYHLIGDTDSIIQLVRFENEAFQDGTGSNRWAVGISLAMNAGDWPHLSSVRRNQFVATAAQMASIAAFWFESIGLSFPDAIRLTKSESDQSNASGFIAHADRDPARRSDPGAGFPWSNFLSQYQELLTGNTGTDRETRIKQLQRLIGATDDGFVGPVTLNALNHNWLGRDDSFDSSVADTFVNNPNLIKWVQNRIDAHDGFSIGIDGVFGPATEAAVRTYFGKGGVVAAESFIALLD